MNKQDLYTWLKLILPPVVAMGAVFFAYFRVLKLAKEKRLVDEPEKRKLQKKPIPVLGGIAVFFGVFFGVLAFNCFEPKATLLLPVLFAMCVMLFVGVFDDLIGLKATERILLEAMVIAACIASTHCCVDSLHGLWGVGQFSLWIGVPLTLFAGVGIINAINMIDGVNGLSSGLCIICGCAFSFAFLKNGDYLNAMIGFIMSASLVPFFLHNVFGKESRMFIGDSGTMVMGTMLTWFMIGMLSHKTPDIHGGERQVGMVAMTLAILSLPIADTLRVMFGRIRRGQSPFHPDKTHLHHMFITMGISHSITTACELLLNIIVICIWYASYKLGASVDTQFLIVVIAAAILVWGTYGILKYHEKHQTRFFRRIKIFSAKTHLGHTMWWKTLTYYLDAPEFDKSERKRMKQALKEEKQLRKSWKAGETEMTCEKENNIVMNYKERDRELIVEFLREKNGVAVEDIIKNAGAEKLRVYNILHEMEQDGSIKVIETEFLGAPKIVCLSL